ncbi:4-methyl-5(b-hydroxyethyl)-thiazole monophosphate biosynthesis [Clostridium acetobutylicum]|uniref:Intracellular protease/amidase (ThiJ family) n=1 Tax=Clostridium acetobutylicum (strain ATCC 824 / DSM 792 / JCM 1419 / IAM 19013 / LMG 5710 / NBRC 13948 / NRRL B-527 / VKM B-1787 / 2291 / W) TaxID=272562 RepID=Q97DX0_CLOAB|nr:MULTISPECIES: DJ-1/PfpI family protein [Clostridium]AAK81282.1 Putative intracellular protease/amidase (ThiJ family) [Clostridium acetobutylicum ATCC 824]ADZ22390.1 Putative intracellular protease/amidase (ThiJ family) [Clostridium acetobutylicum EA 2018]AEI32787.1 intracellular protease/amidase [Clostridium acetobutylicum DSM 1731]AWV81051.1 DJ-1 family protein [Clostridium acetobutylicum]MBC2395565.1 DJ-1/PfpI family protein [Clostridium acetobutylicum]
MKKILLLLANGFEAVEASVFTDVLGWNMLEGDGSTLVVTAGMHDKIKCTWNFTVLPEIKIKNVNVDDFEALVIPGGFEEAGFFIDAYSNSFLDLIRTFNAKGKIIASVCVGALSIGKSGILKGRTATTYNLNDRKRQYELSKFGVKILENQPIVIDKNVITSYNPSTAFNVAFTLLEMLTSTENCTKVKKLMGFI